MSFEMSINIPPDEHGYVGRECPECEAYFKIKPGTGLEEIDTCTCPYCGHTEDAGSYFTQAQIDYATSIAVNKAMGSLIKELKKHEFNYRPRGGFGIGMSLNVEGKPSPIQYYREDKLETEAVCDNCTLAYSVFGVFGFCPDCGIHNSQQIFEKNLELITKVLDLVPTLEEELQDHFISDALENVVSAFDGFGREVCRIFADKATDPAKASSISFQNPAGAHKNVQTLFGLDLSLPLTASEWEFLIRCFEKRHLITHKMGIIDESYVKKANDSFAEIGHKVTIDEQEVRQLIEYVRRISSHLSTELSK